MKAIWWILGIAVFGFVFGRSSDPARPETARAPATQSSEQTGAVVQAQPNVQANSASYLFVTGNRVRQRSGPSTSNDVMGQLDRGARVRLVETTNGWTRVVSSLGNGWMSSQYLSFDRPSQVAAEPRQTTRQVAVPTSREIRDARAAIIRQSIASYSGSCPCPYNTDRGGRRCGGRSAWSRPGGYSPICYESDVSEARLKTYFARRR
jgi:uncharacterized protein YraI